MNGFSSEYLNDLIGTSSIQTCQCLTSSYDHSDEKLCFDCEHAAKETAHPNNVVIFKKKSRRYGRLIKYRILDALFL